MRTRVRGRRSPSSPSGSRRWPLWRNPSSGRKTSSRSGCSQHCRCDTAAGRACTCLKGEPLILQPKCRHNFRRSILGRQTNTCNSCRCMTSHRRRILRCSGCRSSTTSHLQSNIGQRRWVRHPVRREVQTKTWRWWNEPKTEEE